MESLAFDGRGHRARALVSIARGGGGGRQRGWRLPPETRRRRQSPFHGTPLRRGCNYLWQIFALHLPFNHSNRLQQERSRSFPCDVGLISPSSCRREQERIQERAMNTSHDPTLFQGKTSHFSNHTFSLFTTENCQFQNETKG